MSDIENEGNEPDTVITGPEDGEGGGNIAEPVVHTCHAYRVDFEDGTSREYVAIDDVAAIYLAGYDKPGVARLQISRIRKNISVNVKEGN